MIAADSSGPTIHHCEAHTSFGRICGCGQYGPDLGHDLEIDEELPWRAA
jgi:hypothetical protein